MKVFPGTLGAVVLLSVAGGLLLWWRNPRIGHVKDEALSVGFTADHFRAADEDYFHALDGGIALTPQEVQGRNTWLIWSGGNDRLWDKLTVASFGNFDLLKTLSSYPGQLASRDTRWRDMGVLNNPCFVKAIAPDPARFGLWLDKRRPGCAPDPFEDEQKYPGVRVGARGKTLPAGSYYGYETGILGLRLFPNPEFNEAAQKRWDPLRYYKDPRYFNDKGLVRPYRVGMSCGFCHLGPNPLRPPADPNNPQWENLSSNVGAQYLHVDRVFYWSGDQTNFVYQVFHTSRPGTSDTSLIASDNINNPRTMNAIYLLGPRLAQARRWGQETLSGGSLNNRQIPAYFNPPVSVWAPHILKDGADSVGALGALNRVYLNIGTFSEQLLLHFNPLVGGKPESAIAVADARNHSAYFAATEAQTPSVAAFFLKTTAAQHLEEAPGGDRYLPKDETVLTRGKVAFAERCARCHSSKLPQPAPGLDPNGCPGKGYLDCWNRYWTWTQTPEFKQKMRQIVLADDFLTDNYLSADFRVPVTLLKTNACSPLATNALSGHIWDNFSSQTYKDLPSVGVITWYHPVTGKPQTYEMPAGGRGYTRVPSLVSLWSTAPYLLNNSVGPFNPEPSVSGRMQSFQASIEQMLWPEKRPHDPLLPGIIDRTTTRSYLKIATGFLPDGLQPLLRGGELRLGPIPAGTPVGLLANLNPFADPETVFKVVAQLDAELAEVGSRPEEAQDKQILLKAVDSLLSISTCPDLVVNRGHYFGTNYSEPGEPLRTREPGLSDSDKRALIEFLKTM